MERMTDKTSFITPPPCSFFELWMEENAKLWDQYSFEQHLILIMCAVVAGEIEMGRYPAVTRSVFSRV